MATAEEDHLAKAERFLATARAARAARDYDSCVSRSAYAVHHACIALLLRNGSPQSIAEASKPKIATEFAALVRRRYPRITRLRDKRESGSLQYSLANLTILRNVADYAVPGVSASDTAIAYDFARRILEEVRGAT